MEMLAEQEGHQLSVSSVFRILRELGSPSLASGVGHRTGDDPSRERCVIS
jgi:hypothetical protein